MKMLYWAENSPLYKNNDYIKASLNKFLAVGTTNLLKIKLLFNFYFESTAVNWPPSLHINNWV